MSNDERTFIKEGSAIRNINESSTMPALGFKIQLIS